MPQPDEVLRTSQAVRDAYRAAWLIVTQEQEQLADQPEKFRRRDRLAEMRNRIEAVMDDVDETGRLWIAERFPDTYAAGAATTAPEQFGWSQIHREAVEELAQELTYDLLTATKNVRKSTKQLIRTVARDESLRKAIVGDTAGGASKRMREILEKKGIHAVVYANGAKHGLGEYADMAIRTKTAQAYNVGTLNGAPDVTYWEVFDGPTCGWSSHDDTTLALGRVVSRDEALANPTAHPNCRRAFGPRPDITNKKDAQRRGQSQVTAEQRQAQIEQDLARGERQRAARNRLARQQRRQRVTRAAKSEKTPTSIAEGAAFRRKRESLGMSRPDLSAKTDITVARIAGIENGVPMNLLERSRMESVLGKVGPGTEPHVPHVPTNTVPKLAPTPAPPAQARTQTIMNEAMSRHSFTESLKRLNESPVRLDHFFAINTDPLTYREAVQFLDAMLDRYPVATRQLDGLSMFSASEMPMKGAWAVTRAQSQRAAQLANSRTDIILNAAYFNPKQMTRADLIAKRNQHAAMGWFSSSEHPVAATIVHEFGHHLDFQLDTKSHSALMRRISDSLDLKFDLNPGRLVRENATRFSREVSRYGATDQYELIAEAFSEYITSKNPRTVARVVGEYFDEIFGDPGA